VDILTHPYCNSGYQLLFRWALYHNCQQFRFLSYVWPLRHPQVLTIHNIVVVMNLLRWLSWLSPSLRWHVAYIEASSTNPQPHDDELYKDSVKSSCSMLSCPSSTKPFKKNTESKRKTVIKPCHTLSLSQMTLSDAVGGINGMPIPKRGGRLCCQLQLSWPPVNHSSNGNAQSSWSIIDSHTLLHGPNHALCCQRQHWRHLSVAIFSSIQLIKWKCWSSCAITCRCL